MSAAGFGWRLASWGFGRGLGGCGGGFLVELSLGLLWSRARRVLGAAGMFGPTIARSMQRVTRPFGVHSSYRALVEVLV